MPYINIASNINNKLNNKQNDYVKEITTYKALLLFSVNLFLISIVQDGQRMYVCVSILMNSLLDRNSRE